MTQSSKTVGATRALIEVEVVKSVCVLTLNRPGVRNALSTALCDALRAAIAGQERVARVFVITGKGSAFCAGADLKERAGMDVNAIRAQNRRIFGTVQAVANLGQPVIAAINGPALAGGLELALACDLRLAVPSAVFGLVETTIGIIPGAGGTQRLPRLVGPARAKEMILMGRRIDASEALQYGLVNRVVQPTHLLETALEVAGKIAANAPRAIEAAKFLIDKTSSIDIDSGFDLERRFQFALYATQDCAEGVQAFNEKRPPEFRGQ